MKPIKVEVENLEVALKNSHGDVVIIPKNKASWVKQKLSEGCHVCIDSLVESLPSMKDYAEDGTIIPKEPIYQGGVLEEVIVTAEAPQWLKYKREAEAKYNKDLSFKENPYLKKYKPERHEALLNSYNTARESYVKESVAGQILKNNPYDKKQKADDYFMSLSEIERGYLENSTAWDKSSKTYLDKIEGGLLSINSGPVQFKNPSYTKKEAKESTPLDIVEGVGGYASKPLQALGNNLGLTNFKRGDGKKYNFTDALQGKQNDAGMIADAATDLTNFIGVGLWSKLSKANKFAKMEDAYQAVKGLSKEEALSKLNQIAETPKIAPQYNPSNNLIIKSIEDGSPLEKQLSKSGEININSLNAHIGKSETAKADKYILQKVLDEKFAGKTSINYNEFKNSISDELVPLNNKAFTEDYSNYGVSRLGYPNARKESFEQAISYGEKEIASLKEKLNNKPFKNLYGENRYPIEATSWESVEVKTANIKAQLDDQLLRLERNKLEMQNLPKENQTITFSNTERFGKGSADHYDENTLGHSRYLVSNEEPNVFHALETQSDLFQRYGINPIDIERHQLSLGRMERVQNNNKKVLENMKKTRLDEAGLPVQEYQIKQFEDIVKKQGEANVMAKGDVANFEQKQLLGDKHLERLLQENVDFASKNGQTVMRYPTSETAAKIQGYGKQATSANIQAQNRVKNMEERINNHNSLFEDNFDHPKYQELLDKHTSNLENAKEELLKNPVDYKSEHQTILKKYKDTPKMVKKTLGQDTKTVTDAKGNTWYEFDIPESFKEGKGKIKALGIIPPAIIGTQAIKNTKEQ